MKEPVKSVRKNTILEEKTELFSDGHMYRKQHFQYVAKDNESVVLCDAFEFVRAD